MAEQDQVAAEAALNDEFLNMLKSELARVKSELVEVERQYDAAGKVRAELRACRDALKLLINRRLP